jgi:orotate phosphoribosyltransferase
LGCRYGFSAGRRLTYHSLCVAAKDHGEGGVIVGASLKGQKVLIIDDGMRCG